MSKDNANRDHQSQQTLEIVNVTFKQTEDSKFLPIRKVPRTYQSIRAKSVGPDGVPIHFESKIEHDVFLLLKFDHEIDYVVEQPVKIEFLCKNNKSKSFTPDLLIHYKEDSGISLAPTLIEIKYREEVENNPSRTEEETIVATKLCEQEGWEFRLITDSDINYIKLKNVKFLRRFEIVDDRHDYDYENIPNIIDAIKKLKKSTPKKLIESITETELDYVELLPYLWHLVRWGQIKADLNKPLNMNTLIWHE